MEEKTSDALSLESTYRKRIQSAKKWIFETDKTMQFCYSSDTVKDMLGISATEIIGMSPFAFIPEFIVESTKKKLYQLVVEKRKPFSIQLPHLTANKELKLFVVEAEPVYDEAGEFQVLRGSVTDITDLINNTIKMDKIFDNAGIGMAMISMEDKFINVNRALCEMVGYTKEELLSNKYQLVHADDWQATKRNIQLLMLDEINNSFMEKRLIAKDGSVIWVSQNTTLIPNAFGTPWIFLLQLQNITESIKIREQLTEASKRAESSDLLKTALLYNINHEFRTPLNGMIGLSELISQSTQNADIREMAQNITTCSKRLSSVLESMILLSQLSSTCYNCNYEMINLRQTVDSAIQSLYQLIRNRKITYEVDIIKDILILSDSFLLMKVIAQILDNSIKFSQIGSRICIKAEFTEILGEYEVKLAIQDFGEGISDEYQHKLFQPFTQENEGINRAFEGLGIGLSIVGKAMEYLKSEVEIQSQKKQGTTVILTFKRAAIISEKDIKALKAAETSENKKHIRSRYALPNVLLIEDNTINAKLIEQYLLDKFQVTSVRTGEEAVETCHKKRFELILTDIHLGKGINGIEAINRIKLIEAFRNTPVIAVSGYFDTITDPQLRSDKFSAYLAKPFDQEGLLQMIDQILIPSD